MKVLGITVSGASVTVVGHDEENSDFFYDSTWKLQTGEKSLAYDVMYNRLLNFIAENAIDSVVIKPSSLGKNTKLSHLKSAELRGVVLAAASASGVPVKEVSKSTVSRTFGARKADEYIDDNSFWDEKDSDIRKGSRETALLVLSQKDKK